jgi:hypothetical protein
MSLFDDAKTVDKSSADTIIDDEHNLICFTSSSPALIIFD